MTNLEKLQAVRERFSEATGKTLTHKRIAALLPDRSLYTVAHWFDKSQTRPIPNDTLELLIFKVEAEIKKAQEAA